MKKVTEFYGSIGIAGIALLFVLLIFTSSWFFQGLQGFFPVEERNYEDYEDAKATHEILTTPSPRVEMISYHITQNTLCNLKQMIGVYNHQGNAIPFEILSIMDQEGRDLGDGQNMESFLFEKSGKYEISIRATDENGISIQKKLWIPVMAENR